MVPGVFFHYFDRKWHFRVGNQMTKGDLMIIKQAVEVLELYQEADPSYPIKVLPLLREVAEKHDKKALAVITETPAQKFVRIFGEVYKQCTGHLYKADNKAYILSTRLINSYGYDEVKQKAQILAFYCRDGKQWFVKDGWASFTIETLSARWNNLLPITRLTPEQIKDKRYQDELKKWEAHDAAINTAIIGTRTQSDHNGARTAPCATG